MPGYGQSSKHAEHRVSLDLQGELFADLLAHWGCRRRGWSRTTSGERWRYERTCCTKCSSPPCLWSTSSPWHPGGQTSSVWCASTQRCWAPCRVPSTRVHCGPTSRAPATSASRRPRWMPWVAMARRARAGRLLPPDRPGRPGLHRRDRALVPRARPTGARRVGTRGHLDPRRPCSPSERTHPRSPAPSHRRRGPSGPAGPAGSAGDDTRPVARHGALSHKDAAEPGPNQRVPAPPTPQRRCGPQKSAEEHPYLGKVVLRGRPAMPRVQPLDSSPEWDHG